jgi:hypothetical protein
MMKKPVLTARNAFRCPPGKSGLRRGRTRAEMSENVTNRAPATARPIEKPTERPVAVASIAGGT